MIPVSLWALEFLALMKEFWPTRGFLKTTEITYHQQCLLRADIVKFHLHKATASQMLDVHFKHILDENPTAITMASPKSQRGSCPFCFSTLIWNYKQISVMCRAMLVVCALKGHLQRSQHYFVFCSVAEARF